MAAKQMWVEKYRPKALSEYVFHDDHQRKQIERLVREQDLPHLLLTGTAGAGKTSLARVLINELGIDEMDVLEENASDKTGVDFIRDTVIPFTEGYPIGTFRVVHLEEFDYLSPNAQGMLRAVLETQSSTCRFICTCNYENKIIPAIKSRFQQFRFKAPSEDDVVVKMVEILDAEKVKFDDEQLILYIKQAYPDIRKIIQHLQENTIDGRLLSPKETSVGGDYKFKLLDLLASMDLRGIRKVVSEQVPQEELEEVYRFLYQNIGTMPACKQSTETYDKAILVLADAMRVHALSALPHLTFEAMCIKLMMHVGG